MRIKVKCNGKLSPKGMDFSDLHFSLETEHLENVQFVEYRFAKKEEEVKTGEFFRKVKTTERHCWQSFDGFACGEKIFYQAAVTTDGGEYLSEVGCAEQGLVEKTVVGRWIENGKFDGRVSEFLKSFVIDEEIVSARLYVVGLGFYSSAINGVLTDEYYFKPLLTDFDERRNLKNNPWYDEENFANGKKSVAYDTYDVTGLLKKGENELRVSLGTGWYCNTDKDFVDCSFTFGTPKLFFELHVHGVHSDYVIKSDDTCLVRNTHCKSQMFAGDFVDFTKTEEPFEKAKFCAPPKGKLVPAIAEKDAVIESLQPLETRKKGNQLLLDFGKNHTGGLKLTVQGARGDIFRVKYYEVLGKDGEPNPITCRWVAYLDGKEPIDYIDQQGEYTLSGDVDEIRPLFHWNCYRYAVIELPEGCEILSLDSLFISTDLEQDGEFRCSFKVLNDLYRAFVLTQRDNMHCGVPSDCPHREKLPYTGDGQLVAESAMYVFDAENFYRKWLRDIIDAQGKNGWVPYTAPYISGGGGCWWSNALPTVALELYKFTGDKAVLREALQPALRLIAYYESMHDGDYVIKRGCSKWLLGDWLAPDPIASNVPYINTLAFYSAVLQTKTSAEILSERKIAKDLGDLLERIKRGINENFFDAENLRYGNGVQGEDVLPLVYGIVEEEYEEKLWEKLVQHYRKTRRFDTGIVLTPALLNLLTEKGAVDVAMALMIARGYPSYEWMLEKETTLCEHWSKYWPKTCSAEGVEEALSGDVSHCHPMYGSVVAWLYKHVAGLDLSQAYENKILFAPKFSDEVYEAEAKKKTAYGVAAIKYDSSGGSLKMQVRVPYGMEGEVRIPATVCETFYVSGAKQLKSRKRGNYIYAKLSGGEWMISSDCSFGANQRR